jgi:hypothetical protein
MGSFIKVVMLGLGLGLGLGLKGDGDVYSPPLVILGGHLKKPYGFTLFFIKVFGKLFSSSNSLP